MMSYAGDQFEGGPPHSFDFVGAPASLQSLKAPGIEAETQTETLEKETVE